MHGGRAGRKIKLLLLKIYHTAYQKHKNKTISSIYLFSYAISLEITSVTSGLNDFPVCCLVVDSVRLKPMVIANG